MHISSYHIISHRGIVWNIVWRYTGWAS